MKEVKHQIDKHDRLSLQIVSDNIAKIVEKENDMNLSKYIRSLNENLSKAYTRSIKDDGDPKVSPLLEQMDVVSYDITTFLMQNVPSSLLLTGEPEQVPTFENS